MTTLDQLVADHPDAARIFDRLGLDYCCHGSRDLETAAVDAGLDPAVVAAELASLDAGVARPSWWELEAPALADDIIATHHAFLREELPLLEQMATKLRAVHGDRHPELVAVERLVHELRADLEPHLDKEERVLFPAIHALFAGRREFPFGTVANPIRMMTDEHDRAGELLFEIRRETSGFHPPADGCASFRSFYRRLEELEHDTHVHIHKENHRLFPAAVAEEART